jgi:hypothetical protein
MNHESAPIYLFISNSKITEKNPGGPDYNREGHLSRIFLSCHEARIGLIGGLHGTNKKYPADLV